MTEKTLIFSYLLNRILPLGVYETPWRISNSREFFHLGIAHPSFKQATYRYEELPNSAQTCIQVGSGR